MEDKLYYYEINNDYEFIIAIREIDKRGFLWMYGDKPSEWCPRNKYPYYIIEEGCKRIYYKSEDDMEFALIKRHFRYEYPNDESNNLNSHLSDVYAIESDSLLTAMANLTYDEFVESIETMGFSAISSEKSIAIHDKDHIVGTVSTQQLKEIDTNFTGFSKLSKPFRDRLFILLLHYTYTPLDIRNENKIKEVIMPKENITEAEFIQQVTGLGFFTDSGDEVIVRNREGDVVATVGRHFTKEIDTQWLRFRELNSIMQDEIFLLLSRYANTPLDKR